MGDDAAVILTGGLVVLVGAVGNGSVLLIADGFLNGERFALLSPYTAVPRKYHGRRNAYAIASAGVMVWPSSHASANVASSNIACAPFTIIS